jgi:TRAP transporter TAXI family solute receptor
LIGAPHRRTSTGGYVSYPPRYLLISAAIVMLVGLAAGVSVLLRPAVPRVIVMATGAEGGAYVEYGKRYQEFFARRGVQLTVLRSSGSVENLMMLNRGKASIAFVQSGLTTSRQSPDLASLGTVSIEPLWIFCRAGCKRLDLLRGKSVSVGPLGSGNRSLALELLARSSINERNTVLLPLTADQAATRLISGDGLAAALIVASSQAPAVRRLLASPQVRLLSLQRASTYVAFYPYLSKVVLPAGFADLRHDRPAADVPMVAVKTNLVVRRDLPSAVQYLLLEAASRIHAEAGAFQRAGQFPADQTTDLPLSEDARDFYRSGSPLLQRDLPLWLAILVKQLAIVLIPAAAVGYPLLRTLPAIYAWGMRRRTYMLYGELRQVELALEDREQGNRSVALSDLSRLEHRAAHLRVPSSFAHLVYTLRRDIGAIRARAMQMPAGGEPYEVARALEREARFVEPRAASSSARPNPKDALAPPSGR